MEVQGAAHSKSESKPKMRKKASINVNLTKEDMVSLVSAFEAKRTTEVNNRSVTEVSRDTFEQPEESKDSHQASVSESIRLLDRATNYFKNTFCKRNDDSTKARDTVMRIPTIRRE